MNIEKKLQLKPDMKGAVIGKPRGLQFPVASSSRKSDLDFVVVFNNCAADVVKISAPALDRLRDDGLAWFCYPKKSSKLFVDLSRDHGWEPLSKIGYRGVRQIAIDDDWSALRFRKKELVGK